MKKIINNEKITSGEIPSLIGLIPATVAGFRR
jgi:hypothetical protein